MRERERDLHEKYIKSFVEYYTEHEILYYNTLFYGKSLFNFLKQKLYK